LPRRLLKLNELQGLLRSAFNSNNLAGIILSKAVRIPARRYSQEGGASMRRGNRSLYMAASLLCCVVGISAVMSLLIARAVPAAAPQDLVNAAYAAMGGDKLKTISLKASLEQFDPGESYSVSDPTKPDTGVSELVESRDLVRGFARNEWVRPLPGGVTKRTYTEIITPVAGYVIGDDAAPGRLPKRTTKTTPPEHTMSGRRLTANLRELERPMIVIEMKKHPDWLSEIADQKVGGKTYPALQYRGDYGTFIVMFDPTTNLPARIRTLDWDGLEGDSVFDAEYSDWRDVGGAKIAFHALYTLNGMKIADLKLSDAKANPTLDSATFNIPQTMLANAAKPAPANMTPFQWVIRRQFLGFYFDSDAMYTDDGDNLRLEDVGPNISQTQGGTHNTIFIATNTYLIVVEAPNDDGQAIQSIDMAKKKYPGKPIRYLILTHHHVDHISGMRTYAAEGATIVVGKGNGDYFRKLLARPETLNRFAQKKSFTPKVIEVDGKWSVNDGGREVDAYAIENPHAAGYDMVYVPDAKLGVISDLYVPGAPVPSNAMVAALVKGVDKWGIKPERFAGGHGSTGPYADVVQAAQKVKTGAS
jgi:glyoxylase-like metal-dependent hydrolase (beta-lactamase superfamily II)